MPVVSCILDTHLPAHRYAAGLAIGHEYRPNYRHASLSTVVNVTVMHELARWYSVRKYIYIYITSFVLHFKNWYIVLNL